MVLRKSFYIRWSAGRSPRVHEVNPGRDPSWNLQLPLDPTPNSLLLQGGRVSSHSSSELSSSEGV